MGCRFCRLKVMSKIRDMADSDAYPPTCSFTVGGDEPRFTVRILPRAEKATKIPHHLIKVLKTAYKFTIRVRITMEDDNSDVIILKEEKAKSKKAKVCWLVLAAFNRSTLFYVNCSAFRSAKVRIRQFK